MERKMDHRCGRRDRIIEVANGVLYYGNCLEVMAHFEDNRFDSIVTDPPYGWRFMGYRWDYDVPHRRVFESMLRVSKPGAIMMCFGGTRTFHRVACNIEDAGWVIVDTIMWLYGKGMPKGLNVSKSIEKAGGNSINIEEWNGWYTKLKPAYEPIIVAMKPIDKSYMRNALTWGVAGFWVDGCRTEYKNEADRRSATPQGQCATKVGVIGTELDAGRKIKRVEYERPERKGRFPSNIILDEESARTLDEQSGFLGLGGDTVSSKRSKVKNVYGKYKERFSWRSHGDSGGASRFFYCNKASPKERRGYNTHPTVKPLSLMEYLCKLTKTPTGGEVLDPYIGSGTTALACEMVGRRWVGIELDKDNIDIAKRRIEEYMEENILFYSGGG